MTIELLQKRLQEIEKLMQQTAANFNMLEGGKAETLYWLNRLKANDDASFLPSSHVEAAS